MTDATTPDPLDALRARAERGEPAGPDAVLAAARHAAAEDPATDGPAPASAARSRRWLATAAAVAVVAAAGAGAVLVARGDRTSNGAPADPFCAALEASALPPYDVEVDVVVYVEPGASPETVAGLLADLEADPDVATVRYIDVDASYQRFRELFRGEDVMLDNVRPDDLPTSFETTLVEGADPGEVGARWRSAPSVWEVRDRDTQVGRVLDVLYWVGVDPRVTADDFIGPMSDDVKAGWDERVRAAGAATSPFVWSAISELSYALEERRRPLDPDGPEAEEAAGYAARLADAARTDCGLTPRPTAPAASDTVSASPTTTAPPVPPGAGTTTSMAPTTTHGATTTATSTTAPATTTSTGPDGTTTSTSGG